MVNNSQMWMVIIIAFLLLFCLDVKVSQMEKRNAQLNTQCDISVLKCPIKITETKVYVIAFDPIKILTCWAIQNDRQNLSFVKAINEVGEKMARNTHKMANS